MKTETPDLNGFTVLKVHNPYGSSILHGCRFRLVVNTYKGCENLCQYCLAYSYTKLQDIIEPKCKAEFTSRLDREIQRYEACGLRKRMVYVSSSCEPLQPKLEDKYKHTPYALRRLKEAAFPIIIMTKNRFEPYAPSPQHRMQALHELSRAGFKAIARVDPIIPLYGDVKGQSRQEISALVEQLHSNGVMNIISKCLRLSSGIKKLYPDFYERLKPYYVANGFRESRSIYVLNANAKKSMLAPVYEACENHGMTLWTCMDSAGLAGAARCDGTEEILEISYSRLAEQS